MKACLVVAWLVLAQLTAQAESALLQFNAARSATYFLGSAARHELIRNLGGRPAFAVELATNEWLLLEWNEPRRISSVEISFTNQIPEATQVRLEWWHGVWPDQGHGGWMKLDDPFNGEWVELHAREERRLHGSLFQCLPLDREELPRIKNTGAAFRHSCKLRIRARVPCAIDHIFVNTGATLEHARLRFEWGIRSHTAGKWAPRFEIQNGSILDLGRASAHSVIVQVEYARCEDRLSPDRGYVIFRNGETRSFSVFVDDVLSEGGLFVRDIGVFVSDAQKNLSYSRWRGPSREVWPHTVEESVARMPEQTFDNAQDSIPAKMPPSIFLGLPAYRQEFGVATNGNLELWHDSLRSPGPDADRRPWTAEKLEFQILRSPNAPPSTNALLPVERHLERGWLPIVHQSWKEGALVFEEHCVAVPLVRTKSGFEAKTGAEPAALAVELGIQNTGPAPAAGRLWIGLRPFQPLHFDSDRVLELDAPADGIKRPGLTPLRAHFHVPGRGELRLVQSDPPRVPGSATAAGASEQRVEFAVTLAPGERATMEMALPYIELLDDAERSALTQIHFATAREEATRYWEGRLSRGMQYQVPEPWLNDLFKANLWHVLISTDRDPATGLDEHGAATHGYRNFLNETMMVATSLEMRGEHQEALRLIEPFLKSQGRKGLPGNFKSKEGVFYAAYPMDPDPYTAQGYNMHHGWGLWAAAQHFFWTHDEAYLHQIGPQLAAGCNWIIQERKATQHKNPDGTRPVEFGLAPAGDLEDVAEYLYYYATDAYFYLGLKKAAMALVQIGHPEAKHLNREANLFRKDIRNSVAESVATSPVVRLRDGSYIPYVPPRAYARTHLKEGWIREGLYPALHLVDGEVYPDDHSFVRWMVQDLEDNIFMSAESGYGLEHPKEEFFSRGGFTLQPNLLNLALIYLRRDEIPNFLRAFYNGAAACYYPESVCFAEWVPALGRAGGPLYKTPDECKFIQWMRDMLILERDGRLELGLGVPKAWMQNGKTIRIEGAATFFGPLNFQVQSHAAAGRIEAQIDLKKTGAPSAVILRLRHPFGRRITGASVNGHPARIEPEKDLIQLRAEESSWDVIAEY